jgi:N-methylhydantoinase B
MDVRLDPVLAEVMRHYFVGVTEEMNITMRQTTRSVMAKEVNDFSAALLDAKGAVIAQARPYGLSVFVTSVPQVIEKFAGRFRPGDVLITNDPYSGASHLPDILVVMPIFWQDKILAFAATFQHHTDIGGRFPGGFGTESRQLYEEGLRLPIVHLYREGRPEQSVRDIIAANVRAPEDVLGDLEANVAACRCGARGVLELAEKYGGEAVAAWGAHFIEASARRMAEVIRSIPAGRYQVESEFDDGVATRFGLVLTLLAEDDTLTIDLTGSAPQCEIAFNCPPRFPLASCINPLLGLLQDPDVVANSGLLRGIRLIAPPGTVVNPLFPGAVSSRGQTSSRLQAMLLAALTMAIPGRMPAPDSGGQTIMVFTEERRDGNAPTVLTDIWDSGWGARPHHDGIDGVGPMNLSGFRTSSGELMEVQAPVALEAFGFVRDTGGAGKFRGTVSVLRRFRFTEDGKVMLYTKRSDKLAPGLKGGQPGSRIAARLISAGVQTDLPRQSVLNVAVKAGDVIEHMMNGGSGYGDPRERDPEHVLADVLDEKVSAEAAAAIYGVSIDVGRGTVDLDKTRWMRGSVAVSLH